MYRYNIHINTYYKVYGSMYGCIYASLSLILLHIRIYIYILVVTLYKMHLSRDPCLNNSNSNLTRLCLSVYSMYIGCIGQSHVDGRKIYRTTII